MPWKIKPPMKQPRAHLAAAAQGGKIYVMGGIGERGEPLASVEVYDPKTGESTEGPALSAPRSHFSALMLQERIFALGGKGQRADGSKDLLKTVEIFNPAAQKWDPGPELLSPHAGGGAAVWRGIIYVVGGASPDGTDRNDTGIGFAQRWDPLRKKWFEIPAMPTPRFDFAAVGHNNRLIVMGGKIRQRGQEILFDKAEAFETAQKRWEDYPLTTLPAPMAGVGVCSMANLFIVGGAAKEGVVDHIYSVDQLQKRWIKMDPMPESRAFSAVLTNVAQLDNSIYVLGGRNAAGEPVNTVFAYTT